MSIPVQSIIDRVTHVTKDYARARWTLDEIIMAVNDAITVMPTMAARCASQYRVLTLAAGARQDLRTIDPTARWVRLFELTCNAPGGLPVGRAIRAITRRALDYTHYNWRAATPSGTVREFAADEREPFTFDVYPPAISGTQVHALVSVTPPPIEDEDSDFPLADGFDIPAVDYVLYRLFCKDANDQTYMARSTGHLQAFNLAMGVESKDAQ